jgi:cohesin complex subunit SA-1/2
MSSSAVADATTRRKSGRVVHKPDIYQPDASAPVGPNGSAKRKRDAPPVAEPEDDIDSEDVSDDEGEPDDEELREQRRKTKSRPGKSKPANKKPKVAKNESISLAMRPATNGVKRSSKPKKARARHGTAAGAEGTGLYGAWKHHEKAETNLA